MSFLDQLRQAEAETEAAAQTVDPYRAPLERVCGQIGDDGLERITTQVLLDMLGLPQRSRRAGTYKRIAKLMAELGWTAVRVRGLTRGGYLDQVRGYARDARHRSTPPAQDRARIIYGAPALGSPDISDLLLSPSPIDPPSKHIAATQSERNVS